MRTIARAIGMVVALLMAAAFTAVAQESPGEQIKQGAKKAGQTVKETAKTVGEKTKEAAETVAEKTKEAAETVGEKTKEAWRKTKAYASENRATYRKGARQKLNELKSEITELKGRRSEAADPEAFDKQLDTLSQQQATAEDQLGKMKSTTGTKDYSEARKQFDTTIDEMEDGIAQARKQLRG